MAQGVTIQAGDVLAGKYRVERVLGSGGMGTVVAARHLDLDELRAVKLMHPSQADNAQAVERFLREARATSCLKSEHIPTLYDVGRLESGAPYIVMEVLEGSDLRAMLKTRGPLPVGEAVLYILQAGEAIVEAHAAGIIHRDLKPANLFLTKRRDGSPCVKVLDFGISKLLFDPAHPGADMTKTLDVLGSIHYMAPEQLRSSRSVDARADVWSLGVILYRLLTGKLPFQGDTPVAYIMALREPLHRPSAFRADIPRELDEVILRALEKDPKNRTATVAELMVELTPFGPAKPGVRRAPLGAAYSYGGAADFVEPDDFAEDIRAEARGPDDHADAGGHAGTNGHAGAGGHADAGGHAEAANRAGANGSPAPSPATQSVPVELPEPDTEDSLSGMMEARPNPPAAYARLPGYGSGGARPMTPISPAAMPLPPPPARDEEIDLEPEEDLQSAEPEPEPEPLPDLEPEAPRADEEGEAAPDEPEPLDATRNDPSTITGVDTSAPEVAAASPLNRARAGSRPLSLPLFILIGCLLGALVGFFIAVIIVTVRRDPTLDARLPEPTTATTGARATEPVAQPSPPAPPQAESAASPPPAPSAASGPDTTAAAPTASTVEVNLEPPAPTATSPAPSVTERPPTASTRATSAKGPGGTIRSNPTSKPPQPTRPKGPIFE